MSCLVFCTLDLKNASSVDYQDAYAELDRLGLKKVHKGSNGNQAVIPTTCAAAGAVSKASRLASRQVAGRITSDVSYVGDAGHSACARSAADWPGTDV